MKRTRRIEIVRYTRRVAVSGGFSAATEPVADQIAADLIREAFAGIEPTPELLNNEGSAPDETAANQPPRRRLPFRLRDLFRLHKRI